MKKILLSVLCLFPVCAVYAANSIGGYAGLGEMMQIKSTPVASAEEPKKGCQPVPCNTSMGDDRLNADTLEIGTAKNAASCYICEDGYCEDGDIVYDLNVPRFVKCKQSYGWIGNDEWRDFTPQLCDENQNVYHSAFIKGDSGLEKIWDIDGIEHKDGEAAGNNTTVHATGKSICYKYRCIGDLNWSMERGKCVAGESKLPPEEDKKKEDDSKEKQCKDGKIHGYEWEVDCVAEGIVGGLKCGKRCNYNGTTTAYVTECQKEYNLDKLIEEDNPVWTGKYKRCVEKKKPGETKQQKCEKSWGTWRGDNGGCVCDANKNLKLDNGECVCLTDKYVRNESTKSCILPDADKQKQECEKGAASGAYWDNGKCKCRDIRKEFVAGKCTEKADIQKCKNIVGAEWSDSLGKCVCKDSANMEFNENMTACVEKAELREKRAAAAIIVRVKEIKKNLTDVQSGLKVSKWKDAQGNFNTARLASDSVAGVVLGTAGALITSSVVKKNQVENGFEDLKCTVGGQIVADWGDQFQVGIQ